MDTTRAHQVLNFRDVYPSSLKLLSEVEKEAEGGRTDITKTVNVNTNLKVIIFAQYKRKVGARLEVWDRISARVLVASAFGTFDEVRGYLAAQKEGDVN